jgi:D-beta-D-heptose 7-phosphate kinase/D-beta-D-heptose 1-phosphate adenosyltransferase
MRILVAGESCKDVFIYGECNRLSPEAPVPVFIPKRGVTNLGMAGNTFRNVQQMAPTAEVVLLTNTNEVTKTRYIEDKSNHMFLRVDEGEENIYEISMDEIRESTIGFVTDVLIVSDYNKGYIPTRKSCEMAQYTYALGGLSLSVLDSKGSLTKRVLETFNFVKVNESEYNKNKELCDEFKNKVIITLGNRGAMYNDKIYSPPVVKETIDVSGAGDTFTSAFALRYHQTHSVDKAIAYANEMASIVISHRGVTTP